MADIHTNVNAPDGGPDEVDEEITLRCGEDDTRTVKVLRSVLKKHSKYFEGEESFKSTEICFDPKIVTFEALEILVLKNLVKKQHLQSYSIKPENMVELIVAADYLQMDGAMELLTERLHSDLNRCPEKPSLYTALRVLKIISRFVNRTKFYDSRSWFRSTPICRTVAQSFKSVTLERPVLELAFDELFNILTHENLNIEEEDVVRVIKMWINCGYEDRKIHFSKLLYCVRYTKTMDIKWLMDELSFFCCDGSEYLSQVSKNYLFAFLSLRHLNSYIPGSGLITSSRFKK